MTYRDRLKSLRLDTDNIKDPATRRNLQGLYDLLLDEDAARSQEEGSPSKDIVPCYVCGCMAQKRSEQPALCPGCIAEGPEAKPHGGPQAPIVATQVAVEWVEDVEYDGRWGV